MVAARTGAPAVAWAHEVPAAGRWQLASTVGAAATLGASVPQQLCRGAGWNARDGKAGEAQHYLVSAWLPPPAAAAAGVTSWTCGCGTGGRCCSCGGCWRRSPTSRAWPSPPLAAGCTWAPRKGSQPMMWTCWRGGALPRARCARPRLEPGRWRVVGTEGRCRGRGRAGAAVLCRGRGVLLPARLVCHVGLHPWQSASMPAQPRRHNRH